MLMHCPSWSPSFIFHTSSENIIQCCKFKTIEFPRIHFPTFILFYTRNFCFMCVITSVTHIIVGTRCDGGGKWRSSSPYLFVKFGNFLFWAETYKFMYVSDVLCNKPSEFLNPVSATKGYFYNLFNRSRR